MCIRDSAYIEYQGERYKSDVQLFATSNIRGIEITTPADTPKTEISTLGGDIVKITGEGFSPELTDNVVVFEDTRAEVLSSTETELIVRANPIPTLGEQEVKVFLKLSVESYCLVPGGCKLTTTDVGNPSLDSSAPVSPSNGVITVNGAGFGDNPIAYIGEYPQETLSSSGVEIQIKLTKYDDNEAFNLVIRTDTINLPIVSVSLPIVPQLFSIYPHLGSIGGEKITFITTGIGLQSASNFNIYYSDSGTQIEVWDEISIVDSVTITCQTKRNTDVPTNALKLSFSHLSSSTGRTTSVTLACSSTSDWEYGTDLSVTPGITNLAKNGGNNQLQISVSGFSFDSTYKVYAYYGNNKVEADPISSNTDLTFSFPDGFSPGAVDVQISFEKDGLLRFSESKQEDVTLNTNISPSLTCSWAGGCILRFDQHSILQGAQQDEISVSVWGNKASIDLSESSNNQLAVRIPHYSNLHSLDTWATCLLYTSPQNPKTPKPHVVEFRLQFKGRELII